MRVATLSVLLFTALAAAFPAIEADEVAARRAPCGETFIGKKCHRYCHGKNVVCVGLLEPHVFVCQCSLGIGGVDAREADASPAEIAAAEE